MASRWATVRAITRARLPRSSRECIRRRPPERILSQESRWAKRRMYNKSILDFVREDTERLTGKLGGTDRRKMDEYLSAVREIEQRIENAERENREFVPSMDKPDGVPAEFAEHVRLMFDLLTVAFQAGLTRVSTFMIGREGSTRTYREIGVPDPHHPL